MDTNTTEIIEKHIKQTIEALGKNNIKGYYAKNREELLKIIGGLVKSDKVITHGGSMSLFESGVIDYLRKDFGTQFKFRDDYADRMEEFYNLAFSADTYLASANAVTMNGEIYNVDGNGNRVAAMIYGPKQVILVCGVNKIVEDEADAVKRNELFSAPINCIRLNRNTPCAKTGHCADCKSEDRICAAFVTLKRQKTKDRIKVIFLAENLGY